VTISRVLIGILLAGFGYGVAVAVATSVALALGLIPEGLPGEMRWQSVQWRALPVLYSAGFMMTLVWAMPGFVIVLATALLRRWNRWIIFAAAGAADALFALWLTSLFGGGVGRMFDDRYGWEALASSLPAGFAGGAAYWFSTGRFLHRRGSDV
jgi:hypothetical protein